MSIRVKFATVTVSKAEFHVQFPYLDKLPGYSE